MPKNYLYVLFASFAWSAYAGVRDGDLVRRLIALAVFWLCIYAIDRLHKVWKAPA